MMPKRGLTAARAFEASARIRAAAEQDGQPGHRGWKVVYAYASILTDRYEFPQAGETIADARAGLEMALSEAER